MKRQSISQAQYEDLLKSVDLFRHGRNHHPKVAKRGDEIVKFFDLREKNFRRRHIMPVATEFVRNAERYAEKGIETIKPKAWYRCVAEKTDVVVYPMIPGRTIYQIINEDKDFSILNRLMQFVASLHEKNCYFRAGHCDNYILMPNSEFAIIDMDNSRFRVDLRRRAKNLFYMIHHATRRQDNDMFVQYGERKLIDEYFSYAGLTSTQQKKLLKILQKYFASVGYQVDFTQ